MNSKTKHLLSRCVGWWLIVCALLWGTPASAVDVAETSEAPAPVLKEESPSTAWLTWSLLAGGGVFLGVCAYFNSEGYNALLDVQRASLLGETLERQEAVDEVHFYQAVTGVTLALGLTAVGAGLTLLLIEGFSDDDEPTPTRMSYDWRDGGGVLWLQTNF